MLQNQRNHVNWKWRHRLSPRTAAALSNKPLPARRTQLGRPRQRKGDKNRGVYPKQYWFNAPVEVCSLWSPDVPEQCRRKRDSPVLDRADPSVKMVAHPGGEPIRPIKEPKDRLEFVPRCILGVCICLPEHRVAMIWVVPATVVFAVPGARTSKNNTARAAQTSQMWSCPATTHRAPHL